MGWRGWRTQKPTELEPIMGWKEYLKALYAHKENKTSVEGKIHGSSLPLNKNNFRFELV